MGGHGFFASESNGCTTWATARSSACSGCSITTPIKDLALPPVTTIHGTILKVETDRFTLKDDSGTIDVSAPLPKGRTLDVAAGERVKVFGNLRSGPKRIFDGYVISKASGHQIIVSNPKPHIGFILQTSFQKQ